MSATALIYGLLSLILAAPLAVYLVRQARHERRTREAIKKGEIHTDGPRAQHPQIDVTHCIGCQSCTAACPEGAVLGMVGGKAAVIRPDKCIGHGLCADACPVGAITLVTASPTVSANLPFLTPEYETSVRNLFITGELGGLALIRNAVVQGRDAVDTISRRAAQEGPKSIPDIYDVVIVGAGPAGISASLRAIENGLRYITLERETLGGSVAKYPRQKLVMTSPVEFPLGARLKKMQLSKENLLAFWQTLCNRQDFHVRLNEPVEHIRKCDDGLFVVSTPVSEYRAWSVVLALGRAGTPKKLGVRGEDLPKVMYRLMEADHYRNNHVLVVGGGDSAVEAAMGLALQPGNVVTLSYRKGEFTRLKERNAQRIAATLRAGSLRVIFNSLPTEITESTVMLESAGQTIQLPNDFVFVFAGGVAPNDFLKKIGVEFGSRDLTLATVREAQEAKALGVT